MSEWKKENCRNCKHKRICRYQKTIQSVAHLELPRYEMIDAIRNQLENLLPKECESFEAIQQYEMRDMKGRLIDRKPLKLWYPNQSEQLWGQLEKKKPCCNFSPFCRCGPSINYSRIISQ